MSFKFFSMDCLVIGPEVVPKRSSRLTKLLTALLALVGVGLDGTRAVEVSLVVEGFATSDGALE